MQWGSEYRTLLEMQADMGVTPKALENQPTLQRRWEYAKDVWNDPTGSRRYTAGGAGNIPISEYDVYAKAYGFSQTEYTEYWEELQNVDNVWLSEVAKKREAAEKQAKKGK